MKQNIKNKFNYIFFYILSGIIAFSVFYGIFQKKDIKEDCLAANNNSVYKIVDSFDVLQDNVPENLNSEINQITKPVITENNIITYKSENEPRAEIDIIYNSRTFKYKDDLMTATDHTVAETIFKRKINDSLDEKMRMVDKCINAGSSIKAGLLYCFPLLSNTVEKVKKEVDCKYVDSQISFDPQRKPMFYITKEKTGFEIIEDRLYHDIYLSFKRSPKSRVVAVPKVLRPQVTTQDNIELTTLRAKFKTDYSISIEERKHNIKLALKSINGTVLMPDKEFSFNKVVGPRTEARGYKIAKIIKNGEYVEGVGGGVCQASTTLYNAALRAGLEITQVRNHSLTPSYIEPSFDAMVTAKSSDLKFKNTEDRPVFIRTYGTENEAYAEIYGTKLKYKISVQSVTLSKGEIPEDKEVIDLKREHVSETALEGEKVRVSYGQGSLMSQGYLIYTDSKGKIISKKKIREDNYNSSHGIIAVAPSPV